MTASLALCIPAYNAENYLPRLMRSARAQAIPFTQILVYDDCSSDNTAQVAKHYGATVISGDINRGCSHGKNVLAEATFCDWIHFHDADDDLLPEFSPLVDQWLKHDRNPYDILLLNFLYIDAASGELLGRSDHDTEALHQDPLKYVIDHKIVNFGIYRRRSFLEAGGFDTDPEVLYNEDNALHQRLAKSGLKFDNLPPVTCLNYKYGGSMSAANHLKCDRAHFHVLSKTIKTHGQVYPDELSRKLWLCVAGLAAGGDWAYVRKALTAAGQLNNRYCRSGGRLFAVLTFIHPYLGVRLRELLIRLFKPHLRA